MQLSIIVPAYNEEKALAKNLPRLKQALENNTDENFSWEIIVCDNNSSDSTAEFANNFGANVVFEPINQIARARNRGASIAKGDWLLFIDADSFPSSELITEIKILMANINIVACGFTMKVVDGPWWYKLIFSFTVNNVVRWFKLAAGACLLCRKTAFQAVGGFSNELYILEEIDFVKRLKHHANRQRQYFEVLTKMPCATSGRKGDLYGVWQFLWLGLKLTFSPKKLPSQKKSLSIWYDGKR